MKKALFIIVCILFYSFSGCRENRENKEYSFAVSHPDIDIKKLEESVRKQTENPSCPKKLTLNKYPNPPTSFPIPSDSKFGMEIWNDRVILQGNNKKWICLSIKPNFAYDCLFSAWQHFGWWIKDTPLCKEDWSEIRAYENALLEDFKKNLQKRKPH